MIKLITSLGNPGRQYVSTRHNIGWMVLDYFSFYSSLNWQKKFKGEFASISINGEKIILLKPETYMNKSGESVQAAMQFFKIKKEEILILHDCLELDFGIVSIKNGGGLAGHNGLRSITSSLGTKEFKRVRLGISKPSHGDISSYVLGKFSEDENAHLPLFLKGAAEVVETILDKGFDSTERIYRKKRIIEF